MMKKSVVAAAMLFAMSASVQVQANEGQGAINFTGSIIDAACSIKPGDDDQTVEFGQVGKASLFKNGGVPRDFSIELENCDASKFESVNVTFTGPLDNKANPNILGISGQAKGAGIKIKNLSASETANQDVTFGQATSISGLQDGSAPHNLLRFQAVMVKTVDKAEEIVEGDFTAQANFVMNYM